MNSAFGHYNVKLRIQKLNHAVELQYTLQRYHIMKIENL